MPHLSFNQLHTPKPSESESCEVVPTFNELRIINSLKESSDCVIYTAYSDIEDKTFVIKAFTYTNSKPSPLFFNEARFQGMAHPNILSLMDSVANQ